MQRGLVIAVALVAATGVVHMLEAPLSVPVHTFLGVFETFCYMGLIFAWGASMRVRLLPSRARACVLTSMWCMAVWLLLRGIRYRMPDALADPVRLMWYGYYPLMLGATIASLLACVFFVIERRGPDARLGATARVAAEILVAVSALVAAGVMTNDVHQLAFAFESGIPSESVSYTHGPLYWASVALMVGSAVAFVIMLMRLAKVSRRRAHPLVPVAVVAIAAVYLVLHTTEPPHDVIPSAVQLPFEFPETICIAVIAMWEWAVMRGLVPANDRYGELFAAATVPVRVTDASLEPALETAVPLAAGREQMAGALEGPVMLDPDTRLQSAPIAAGHMFWEEDLAWVNHANEELRDVAEQLAGASELLAASNELGEERSRIDARGAIYDAAEQALRPTLAGIGASLDGLDPADPDLARKLACLAVRLAYAKRSMNLRLIGMQDGEVGSDELALSIGESLRHLRRCDVECSHTQMSNAPLEAAAACALYDDFERLAEIAVDGAARMLVHVDGRAAALNAAVEPRGSAAELAAALADAGLSAVLEDEAVYVRITASDRPGDARGTPGGEGGAVWA